MRALFDVNLLIALLQPDHAHFERAHLWWEENHVDGWASCPLTQNGFVRILSQSSYQRSMTVTAALEELAEQIRITNHALWADDVSLLDATLFDHARILGPKQLTDVYLLALAMKNGGRLVTLDRSIPLAAVHGAEPKHLVVI